MAGERVVFPYLTMGTLNTHFMKFFSKIGGFELVDYNQKIRYHGNGLIEIRLYEKAITIGKPPNKKIKQPFEIVENPFLDSKVKMKTNFSPGGWQEEYHRDSISLSKSLKRTKDTVFDYSNAVPWEWFCTFTFNSDSVNRKDFDEVSKKMTKWLNNMRSRYCPDMQYVLVPEKHKLEGWHFHGLFRNCDGFKFVQAVNNKKYYRGKKNKRYGQPLVRKGRQVYNISSFSLGFTECTRVSNTKKVSNYILKYITKEMVADTPGKKRYWCSKNLPKPVEEVGLIDIEYECYRDSVFCDCVMKNPEAYCNDFEVVHGDFTNKISYIFY